MKALSNPTSITTSLVRKVDIEKLSSHLKSHEECPLIEECEERYIITYLSLDAQLEKSISRELTQV